MDTFSPSDSGTITATESLTLAVHVLSSLGIPISEFVIGENKLGQGLSLISGNSALSSEHALSLFSDVLIDDIILGVDDIGAGEEHLESTEIYEATTTIELGEGVPLSGFILGDNMLGAEPYILLDDAEMALLSYITTAEGPNLSNFVLGETLLGGDPYYLSSTETSQTAFSLSLYDGPIVDSFVLDKDALGLLRIEAEETFIMSFAKLAEALFSAQGSLLAWFPREQRIGGLLRSETLAPIALTVETNIENSIIYVTADPFAEIGFISLVSGIDLSPVALSRTEHFTTPIINTETFDL